MADLSLDDYIHRKDANFRVQIRNSNTGVMGIKRGRGGSRGRGGNQLNRNNVNLRAPSRNLSARGRGAGRGREQGIQLKKSLQSGSVNPVNQGSVKVFDARDKIASRKRPLDARLKLDTKVRDARKQITNLRLHKGTIDARTLLQKRKKNVVDADIHISAIGDGMNDIPSDFTITRNNVGLQTAPSSTVQLSGNDLHITRSVGGTTETNNFQITKNIVQPIQPQPVQMRPQLIQIRNDQYRSPSVSLRTPPPPAPPLVQNIARTPIDFDYQYDNDYQQDQYDYDFELESESPIVMPLMNIPITAPVTREPIRAPLTRELIRAPVTREPVRAPVTRTTITAPGPQHAVRKTISTPSQKQIVTRKPVPIMSVNTAGVKRKSSPASGPLRLQGSVPLKFSNTVSTKPQISGPLKFAGSEQKVTRLGSVKKSPPKKMKLMEEIEDYEPMEEMDETTEEIDTEMASPLQGHRVVISNLHTVVTQDDIVELFGSIGSVKRAKLLKPGSGEVIYVKKDDALAAVQKYHNRELDGKPMHVKLLTSAINRVKQDPLPPTDKPTGQPLKLAKAVKGMVPQESKSHVDVSLLHRALFKTSTGSMPPKPVKFTVKI